MPLAHRANKPVLKEPLQTNFRPHIALHADLQVNQPLTQIARRFLRFRRKANADVGRHRRHCGNEQWPKRHHKAVVGSDGEQALHTLNIQRFRGGLQYRPCLMHGASGPVPGGFGPGRQHHLPTGPHQDRIACHLPQPAQGAAHGGGAQV